MARAKKAPAAPRDPGKLRVEMMDLDEVVARAFPGNPKAHDADALGESFTEAGYVDPIVIDETTGHNVAGHGRAEKLVAMRDAGEAPPERIEVRGKKWFVPVLRGVAFKDAATASKYLLASNRVAELGGWDNKALAAMLSGYDGSLEGTGFSTEDFARFMTLAAGPSAPDQFPSVDETLQTDHQCPKCGYLWSGSTAPRAKEPDAPKEAKPARARRAS
jgi:hypothetical protein